MVFVDVMTLACEILIIMIKKLPNHIIASLTKISIIHYMRKFVNLVLFMPCLAEMLHVGWNLYAHIFGMLWSVLVYSATP
jgi:hypothetical protein